MRKQLLLTSLLALFVFSTLGVYRFFTVSFTDINSDLSSKFDIKPVSKSNSFVGPINEVLGVTFQHSFELSPEASFSEVGIYDVVVKSVVTDGDSGYLVVRKDKKTMHLPLVGALAIKRVDDTSYSPVNVKDLADLVKKDDILTVHLMYTSPLATLSTEQLQEKLQDSQKEPMSKESILRLKSMTRSGLTENDILGMLSGNNIVKFRPTQLVTSLIEVKGK